MAIRYCGDVKVSIVYTDSGSYKGSVIVGAKRWPFNDLNAPPIGLGSGVAYDSSEGYDKMARAALSFASYVDEDIANGMDYDDKGEPLVRRRK